MTGGDAAAPVDLAMAPVPGASVLQMHHHANRDGVYVDASLTRAAAAKLHQDAAFDGTYAQDGAAGPVYAHPLFVDQGGAGDFVVVATEHNDVIALDAVTGKIKWHTGPGVLGAAVTSGFACGNVHPSGITGTPVIALGTRALFFQTDVDTGKGIAHRIHSLSIDDGSERAGWPIDVDSIIPDFANAQQGERGALLILDGKVFIPFGGRAGDCIPYRGYVIGLPLSNPTPASAVAFATRAADAMGAGAGGGIWSPAGLSSDGTSIYFATGNASGTYPSDWPSAYTNAAFKLSPSLAFDPQDTTRWFAPDYWMMLDTADWDINGSGVLLVDLPGSATPHLAVLLGKDWTMYLLNRDDLGGMTAANGVFHGVVASFTIINAPAWYTTRTATYVAFTALCPYHMEQSIISVPLTAAPATGMEWCATPPGGGSPAVSTTGDGDDTIVWFIGAEGYGITAPDFKLYGFDGDTGDQVVVTAAMTPVHRFESPIVAKGRVYVAADDRLYSFVTP
jgi:hypothetical protein